MSPPPHPAKAKRTWELRALGISVAIVVGVGVLSHLLLGILGPWVAAVGLDGLASGLMHAAPTALAFVTTLILNGVAAWSESRGAGLGAWLGFGLLLLIFRGAAAV